VVAATLMLAGVVYLARKYEWSGWLDEWVNKKTPTLWFVGFMVLLPNFGFPIVAFLLLAGAKFGLVGGLLVAMVTMPVHLLVSFLLVHSFFRPLLTKMLRKLGYGLSRIPENRVVPFTVLFVAVPGLPYAVKNYGLALTGIPFRYYFWISLPINVVLSIPVIGLGTSAVEMDPGRFFFFAAIFIVGYLVMWWIKRKMGGRPEGR